MQCQYLDLSDRYDGPLNEKEQLKGAIDKGLASQQFVNVVDMLCAELKVLMQMEEFVTCPNGTMYCLFSASRLHDVEMSMLAYTVVCII